MEAGGALQDNPALGGIYAEIDLRDNPIPILLASNQEGYNLLKDYWANVTRREPYVLPLNPSREILINEFSISNGGDTLADLMVTFLIGSNFLTLIVMQLT